MAAPLLHRPGRLMGVKVTSVCLLVVFRVAAILQLH